MIPRRKLFAVLCVSAYSASTPAKSTAQAGTCAPGAGITQTAYTPRYKMILDVGPRQAMYTEAQVKAEAER